VGRRRTTRCCSAAALLAYFVAPLAAQPAVPRPFPGPSTKVAKVDRPPPSLLPVRPVWTLVLDNQLTAPPAYDDTHVFFSIEGDRLVAYALSSGTQAWIVSAHPRMEPATGGGLIFLVEPGALKALRADDGSIAWELPFEGEVAVRAVFDNGWLIVSTEAGEILAFRATDGHLVWRRDMKSRVSAPPALTADRVYVSVSDGRVVALRVEDGEPVWERRLGGAPNDILALDERLYVGSKDNFLYCLMTEDGRIDWRWRTGGDVIGRPIADQRQVYFVSLDNVLRALNLKSGGQHWMRPLPMRPVSGPIRAGSTVLVSGVAAAVHAYDVKDGKPASGEPLKPGLPPVVSKAAAVSQPLPGDSPVIAELSMEEAVASMPTAIPPEIAGAETPAASRATSVAADAEVGAPPHAIEDPVTHLPMVLMITRDIARGAAATLVARDFEPVLSPVVALPNLVMIAPATTTPPPVR
jgi:outer membrane protein assembly factor BamB